MKSNPRRKCHKSTLFWRQVLFSARIYKTQIFRKRKWHQCILLSLSVYMATKQISPRLPKKLLASSICKVMCNSISGTAEMQAERGGAIEMGEGRWKDIAEWMANQVVSRTDGKDNIPSCFRLFFVGRLWMKNLGWCFSE